VDCLNVLAVVLLLVLVLVLVGFVVV